MAGVKILMGRDGKQRNNITRNMLQHTMSDNGRKNEGK